MLERWPAFLKTRYVFLVTGRSKNLSGAIVEILFRGDHVNANKSDIPKQITSPPIDPATDIPTSPNTPENVTSLSSPPPGDDSDPEESNSGDPE